MSGIIWGVALALVIGFAIAAYIAGRKTGRTTTLVKEQRDDLEAVRIAREAESGVDALSNEQRRDRLREQWTR